MGGPAELIQGKMFIGLALNVFLFGINIAQTYFYYIHSKKDRFWIKIWVFVIFMADFIQALFCCLYLYQTLIIHFGDVSKLSTANAVFSIVPAMSGLTATIIQLFFARRILILTNNWYCVACVIATATSGGVCAIVVACERRLNPQFVNFKALEPIVVGGYVSEMLADIMITSILVLFLHKNKSGLRPSDKMVDRIIRVTIQTGLVTLILAGLNLIFYLINPTDGKYIFFSLIVSKICTSSVLSSLNSRRGWGYDDSERNEDHLSSNFGLRFASNSTPSGRTSVLVGPPLEDSRGVELTLQNNRRNSEVKGNCGAQRDGVISITHGQSALKGRVDN